MTPQQWAAAHPFYAGIILSYVVALIIGSIGQAIAESVDGEKNPRLFQLGKTMQNWGSAFPKTVERGIAFFRGQKPSEPPAPPPSTDGKTLVIGFVLLVGGVLTNVACGHGAAACKVVDVASDACSVVRYLAPDGTVEELSPQDLAEVAAAKKAARQQQAQVRP